MSQPSTAYRQSSLTRSQPLSVLRYRHVPQGSSPQFSELATDDGADGEDDGELLGGELLGEDDGELGGELLGEDGEELLGGELLGEDGEELLGDELLGEDDGFNRQPQKILNCT